MDEEPQVSPLHHPRRTDNVKNVLPRLRIRLASASVAASLLAVAAGFAVMSSANSALAADATASNAALGKARAAWEKGIFDKAEPLYREALEQGGLAPEEVLEGFVRLGSIRAALGKKDAAIAAFRAASVLDATFTLPPEAGTKAVALAEKAKRDTAKIGSIALGARVPKDASPGKPITITATLDKAHLSVVAKIGVVAKDGTTGKQITLDAKPAEELDFEIGPDLVLPGANLAIRIDALDAHQNRLASVEERIRIPDAVKPDPVAVNPPPVPTAPDPTLRRGGSFWSSPWPYVIGGMALAGAGAAAYFGTRPPPVVSVGPVGVRDQ